MTANTASTASSAAESSPEPAGFPGLARLRLTAEDMEALSRQGFVSREARRRGRGCGRHRYKLRFRVAGVQKVRCIGADRDAAAQVRRELAELQKPRRADQMLARQMRAARRALREAKEASAPLLEERGYKYHGHTIRRTRRHAG
jgi:hypothetical protein